MAAWEDPQLTSSHRPTQSTATYETTLSEKSKLAEQVFHNKWLKGPHQDRQERQRHSPAKNPTPEMVTNNQEGSYNSGAFYEACGIQAPRETPQPLGATNREITPQNRWL